MKHNVANSNRLFVDRPLDHRAVAGNMLPSLWTLCKDDTDYTDAVLRTFLVLCLIASLVLGGLKISGAPTVRESADYSLSTRALSIHPSLPNVNFGASIR